MRLQSEGEGSDERREYQVEFVKAGRVRYRDGSESNWEIPAQTIIDAVNAGKFDELACFIDHVLESWIIPNHPSLRDLFGVTLKGAEWDEASQAAVGVVRVYHKTEAGQLAVALFDQIIEDSEAGQPTPDVGGSIVFFPRNDYIDIGEEPGEEILKITTEFVHIESWDVVFKPGTYARVKEILSSVNNRSVTGENISERLATNGGATMKFCSHCGANLANGEEHRAGCDQQNQEGVAVQQTPPAEVQPQAGTQPNQPQAQPPPVVESNVDSAVLNVLTQSLQQQQEQISQLVGALTQREDASLVEGMGQAPRGGGNRHIGGYSSLDQISAAYHHLMGLDPEDTDDKPYSGKFHKLTGIRELYHLLTGDRGMRGVFDEELVPSFLAYSSSGNNADTTTMAELTRNVMAKVLIQQADLLQDYYWWKNIAKIENLTSLQQVSWVRYGGIGYSSGTGLPSVNEKGEYQQLLWEDARTTADWTKYGGYLPLSLEMIDRDDVMGWKDVPRQLAVAQAVTISSVFSALFTDNSGAGADLSDSVGDGYAFNTTRGNLITQPLDQTNWNLAIETMYKLAQLANSSQSESRRIAARPKFCLVPIELEGQAVSELCTAVKSGASNAQRTPVKRALPEENVITVPHWTDADNWAAVADPNLIPFCGVAFRFGEVPEIFMPGENNHILWLHDVLPIKTRWFFAVSVIDTRGAIKSNN